MDHAASGSVSDELPPEDAGASPTGRQFTMGLFSAWATFTVLAGLAALVYGLLHGGEVVVLFSEQPLWQFIAGAMIVCGLLAAGALLLVAVPLFTLSRPVGRQSTPVRGIIWFAVGTVLAAASLTAAVGIAAAVGASLWSHPEFPAVLALLSLFGGVAGLAGWTTVLFSRSH